MSGNILFNKLSKKELEDEMPKNLVWRIIILLMLVALVEQFATDCYLPAFPAIAKAFSVPDSIVQLSLTLFLVGEAAAQLLFGSLADLYGRRPVLITGLSLFAISSLFCTITTHSSIFLACRLLQGLGAGSGIVIARAVARDLFSDVAFAKIISSLAAIIVLMQLTSPIIGGYIQHFLGWNYIFILITVSAFILLTLIFLMLPETFKIEKIEKIKFFAVLKTYKIYGEVIKNKQFLSNVLFTSLASSITIIYTVTTPFLYQRQLHVSPVLFGWLAALASIGFALGNIVNSRCVEKIGMKKMIQNGLYLTTSSILLMLIIGIFHVFNIEVILIPAFIAIMGIGFISANVSAIALNPFAKIAGSAAAIFGSIQFLIFSVCSAFSAIFHLKNQIGLALLLLVPICIMWRLRYGSQMDNNPKT